jgi:hypothetical protein
MDKELCSGCYHNRAEDFASAERKSGTLEATRDLKRNKLKVKRKDKVPML